jgi:hypothetical protein
VPTANLKQQQFSIIANGASSEFKQAFEAESGQTLEQIKQKVDFNANKNRQTRITNESRSALNKVF